SGAGHLGPHPLWLTHRQTIRAEPDAGDVRQLLSRWFAGIRRRPRRPAPAGARGGGAGLGDDRTISRWLRRGAGGSRSPLHVLGVPWCSHASGVARVALRRLYAGGHISASLFVRRRPHAPVEFDADTPALP